MARLFQKGSSKADLHLSNRARGIGERCSPVESPQTNLYALYAEGIVFDRTIGVKCGWYGGCAYPHFLVYPHFSDTHSIIFFNFYVRNGAFSAIFNDFRFRTWLKMHHSAQKISTIFFRPAARTMRAAGTIFVPPTFEMLRHWIVPSIVIIHNYIGFGLH